MSELKKELLATLKDCYTYEEGWEVSAEIAIYWYASDWYDGQDDPLYRVLCESNYRPGCLERGVSSTDDYLAEMMYNGLVEKYQA